MRAALFIPLILVIALTTTSCATAPEEYANSTPQLDMAEYFNGPLKAWGIVQNRQGKVTRRFEVDLVGTWDGENGILDEQFVFDDGEQQQRTWKLRKLPNNQFTGTAGDVVGEAQGEAAGFALYWDYVLEVPVNDKLYTVRFEDWMYQMNDDVLINRSVMKKFGFRVGEVTLFFQKLDDPQVAGQSWVGSSD